MHFTTLRSLAGVAALLSAPCASGQAFPGAIGFGSVATGGAGGTVVSVTNLDDAGPGSFRDAVSAPNRIVEFKVGGYITLVSPVSISSSVTINGTTAPGNGIGFKGGELSASKQSNIIIQGVRVRQGTLDSDRGKSGINIGKATNVMIDHVSVAYGQFNSIDAVGAQNVTISNSIIAFPIFQQFGCHFEVGPVTFARNLWVSGHNRQALAKSNTQFINNVLYNFEAGYTTGNTKGKFSHDILNNYFIAGPSTKSAKNAYFQINAGQSVFAKGNLLDSNKDGTLNGEPADIVGSATVATAPFAQDSTAIASLTATQAFDQVLAGAGAMPRDEVDTLALTQVKSLGKDGALIKSEASTGLSAQGFGTL